MLIKMLGELPPDPSLESADEITTNRAALDRSRGVLLNCASQFSEHPSLSRHHHLKNIEQIVIDAFRNYASTIAELGDIDDERKKFLISELFREDEEIRVTAFNKIANAAICKIHIPLEVESCYTENLDEADEEEVSEDDEEDDDGDDYTPKLDDWLGEVLHYHASYTKEDVHKLKMHVVESRYSPGLSKMLKWGAKGINLGARSKEPAIAASKEVSKIAIGVAAGIIIAKAVDKRS